MKVVYVTLGTVLTGVCNWSTVSASHLGSHGLRGRLKNCTYLTYIWLLLCLLSVCFWFFFHSQLHTDVYEDLFGVGEEGRALKERQLQEEERKRFRQHKNTTSNVIIMGRGSGKSGKSTNSGKTSKAKWSKKPITSTSPPTNPSSPTTPSPPTTTSPTTTKVSYVTLLCAHSSYLLIHSLRPPPNSSANHTFSKLQYCCKQCWFDTR